LESEWGRNVTLFGLGTLGVTRCARLRATPLSVLTNHVDPGSILALVAELPVHPLIDNIGFSSAVIAGRPTSFPYGYDVI
jgi:hypothetical protein